MKLILAADTPVLLGQSERWSGSDEDVYGFKRKLVVPLSPRLKFGDGESSTEWATVTKILTGISWNARIQVRIRNIEDNDNPVANVLVVDPDDGSSEEQRLLKLFLGPNPNDEEILNLVTIQLGNSVTIDFIKGPWVGPVVSDDSEIESSDNYELDLKLTKKQTVKLLLAKDKDIRVTESISFEAKLTALEFCSRILETGYFSDCEVVSNEGEVTRCHKVVLIENSSKLKKEIEDGSTKLKLELSVHGVRAFLGYLYHGGLDEATENFLKLAVELLQAAGSYEVLNLWSKLVGVLTEKDLDVKVAFAVFDIFVKSRKVETTKELARKLVAVMHAESPVLSGDHGVFIEYFKDQAFFNAWFGLLSDVSTINLELPAKRARLHD